MYDSDLRGRAGYLSLDSNPTGNVAPVPILIWPEADGHGTTLRADGLTAEQLLDVARASVRPTGSGLPRRAAMRPRRPRKPQGDGEPDQGECVVRRVVRRVARRVAEALG